MCAWGQGRKAYLSPKDGVPKENENQFLSIVCL